MRRETSKEYEVEVFDDKRSSDPYRPQAVRWTPRGGQRSVGRGVRRPANRAAKDFNTRAPTLSSEAEGNMSACVMQVPAQLCVVVEAGMRIRSLSGNRDISESTMACVMARIGKMLNRSR